MRNTLIPALLCFSLGSCSSLPSGAPTSTEFEHGTTADDPTFIVLDLDLGMAKKISLFPGPGIGRLGSDRYRPTLALKPGDVISIAVYEVTQTPIFGGTQSVPASGPGQPLGGHVATIPSQVVEQSGVVPIPFGGTVKVAGLTPEQAGNAIVKALQGRATNPQVVVTLVSTILNTATVNGDVGRPGLVALTIRGERVLDVIAASGGPKYPVYDTDVQLVRDHHVTRVNMQQLVDDAAQNLRVKPGDSIVVLHNPRSFSVLGSALKVAQVDFNVEHVTLAEGIARSGGLNDSIADVSEIYLLRFENSDLVAHIARPGALHSQRMRSKTGLVPVAYHLNLRGAGGYFISQSVQLRDKDVILITNAQSVQLSKLLVIVKNIAGIYYDFAIPGGGGGAAARVTKVTPDGG